MEVVLASAAAGDLIDRVRSMLVDTGWTVRPRGRRDVEGCDALVVAVGPDLDPDGLVDLMQVLADARRLAVPVLGLSDGPPEKHPPAVAALQLGCSWVRMGHGAGAELVEAFSPATASDGEPEDRRLRVFLSYSRRDTPLVDTLVEELRERRIEVWRDTESIPGGDGWRASIEAGIRASDAVVVLLTPHVAKQPRWVLAELGVGQTMDKRIVPVRLKRMPAMPDGFGLTLSGTHMIDLFPDYDAGVAKLVKDLGGDDGRRRVAGMLRRARGTARRLRRFAEQHDLKRHAMTVGAAVLATAAAAAAAQRSIESTRQEQANSELTERQATARREYADRTLRLLTDAMKELQASTEMSVEEYRREVKPRMMRIIGSLEAGRPVETDVAFTVRHDQLVKDLERLVAEFDDVFGRIARDETQGLQHAIRRVSDAWAKTLISSVRWLESI